MRNTRLMAAAVIGSLVVSTLAMADVDKKTERVWKAKCASCHGQTGKGDTEQGQKMKVDDMTTAAFQAKSEDDWKKAILNGVQTEKAGVKQEMPGFKDALTPDQVNAMIAYIHTFKT